MPTMLQARKIFQDKLKFDSTNIELRFSCASNIAKKDLHKNDSPVIIWLEIEVKAVKIYH